MRSALHVLTSAQKSLKRVEGSRAATSLSAWMTSCSDAAGQLAAVALVDEAGWGLGEVEELEKEYLKKIMKMYLNHFLLLILQGIN